MGKSRIVKHHWTAVMVAAPESIRDSDHHDQIIEEVRAAIAQLEPDEREVIERYYLRFEEFVTIAAALGIKDGHLATLHNRGLKRLRKLLSPFVQEQFGLDREETTRCPICRSMHRAAIDDLIRARDCRRPWRILLREIRAHYGVMIRTYQTVVSHQRYH